MDLRFCNTCKRNTTHTKKSDYAYRPVFGPGAPKREGQINPRWHCEQCGTQTPRRARKMLVA